MPVLSQVIWALSIVALPWASVATGEGHTSAYVQSENDNNFFYGRRMLLAHDTGVLQRMMSAGGASAGPLEAKGKLAEAAPLYRRALLQSSPASTPSRSVSGSASKSVSSPSQTPSRSVSGSASKSVSSPSRTPSRSVSSSASKSVSSPSQTPSRSVSGSASKSSSPSPSPPRSVSGSASKSPSQTPSRSVSGSASKSSSSSPSRSRSVLFFVEPAPYAPSSTLLIGFDLSNTGFAPTTKDWVGLYNIGVTPDGDPASLNWAYTCGSSSCSQPVSAGSVALAAPSGVGSYAAFLLSNDGYTIIAGPLQFATTGSAENCPSAVTPPSPQTHFYPPDNSDLAVSRVAFSSCYKPDYVPDAKLWGHVRNNFRAQLWLWLGDNMYADGTNMDQKRRAYNAAREQVHYVSTGPVASPKIPVLGTWDDHDYGANNQGNDYQCPLQSQDEFNLHFNIPSTDPRHKDYSGPGPRRAGVYDAKLFPRPGSPSVPGLHVVMLDARSGRDPTYPNFGACRGQSSHFLSAEQWSWLEAELQKEAIVTIIATGIQVLPPTDLESRAQSAYCADDANSGNTFREALAAVGENGVQHGTEYETWGEIPQERARLLLAAQRALNANKTAAVVFVSGDQHWGELMVKRMPPSVAGGGAAQLLYEVTASGINQNWIETIHNSNRVSHRSCDTKHDGVFINSCIFPFTYQGQTYYDCTMVDSADGVNPWCYYSLSAPSLWGTCAPSLSALSQGTFSNSSKTCGSPFHVCSAKANYGGIEVDYDRRRITMSVFTPYESEVISHIITYPRITSLESPSSSSPVLYFVNSAPYAPSSTLRIGFDLSSTGFQSTTKDWVGIYNIGVTPDGDPASLNWAYTCGSSSCSQPVSAGSVALAAPSGVGPYAVFLLSNDGYTIIAGPLEFYTTGSAAPKT